jgi:hypothetical protein
LVRIREQQTQRVDGLRTPGHVNPYDERVGDVDGHCAECLESTVRRAAKMQGFARHVTGDRDDGVVVPGEAVDRQSNEGAAAGLARFDRESRLLRAAYMECAGKEEGQRRWSIDGHVSKIH